MRRGDDPRRKRDGGGRYAIEQRCDLCGKPIHGEYGTDAEVCGGGDGPGFFLCGRKACLAAIRSSTVEQRRAMYVRR